MADFKFFLNRQGVKGETGAKGDQGFSPTITVNTQTANEYTLDITNEGGTYTTPNLRGNAIADEGGSYVRYNRETEEMYAGFADTASTEQFGEVMLCSESDLTSGGAEGLVADSLSVYNFVNSEISGLSSVYLTQSDFDSYVNTTSATLNDLSTNKLDFTDLSNSLIAGTNISLTKDSVNKRITINGQPLTQVQADWSQADNSAPDYIKNKPTLGTMAEENASDYTKTSGLASVATSGDYDDLLNKPTIPAAQVQSDWNQSDVDAPDYIKNKPTIPEGVTVDDDFSTTSTNPVENRLITNAINLISNELEEFADKDLSNLSTDGESRLHALKAYSDNGELLTDAEGLADVTNYAHSTFDLSKFTVTGSPNITDDGIASGFSNSNYLKITNLFSTGATYNSVCLATGFIFQGTYPDMLCEIRTSDNNNRVDLIANSANNKFTFQVASGGTGYNLTAANSTMTLTQGHKYYGYVIVNSTTATGYLLDLTTNTLQSQSITATMPVLSSSTVVYYGFAYAGNSYSSNPLDLKYAKVEANGLTIFSGNITGIDTIKPDDYTVVGTPTISADGVASGFSNSNYLTTSLSSVLPATIDNVAITGEFTYISQAGTSTIVGGSGNNNTPRIYVTNNGKLGFYLYDGSTTHYPEINLSSIQDGDKVKFTVTFSNENITANATINNGTPITTSNNKTLAVNFATALATLSMGHFGSSYSTCPIDLNSIKIYVDGNLVYQPCLKIPYTKGSEQYGGKYVNAQYLPRVKDAYEQGLANDYFTLDEVNGTYTLPMGNLYGMIEKVASTVPSEVVQSSTISNIVSITQADYDALVLAGTTDPNTMYVIVTTVTPR